jgi:DNA helicase HerA-like ATPase
MWGRKRKPETPSEAEAVSPLKEAVRQARIEAAERTSVVVDLRDAEWARLELLNDALDPLFADIPPDVDLFDRGVSRGETPRLWIDAVAHVAMGRDKRMYRFLHDTRVGRHVLAESHEIPDIVKAVTSYVARRIVERQRALDEDPEFVQRVAKSAAEREGRRRRWRAISAFVFGFLLGLLGLFAAGLLIAIQYH